MEYQTIYWANLCQELTLDVEPKPLLNDIAKSQAGYKGGNHVACPAIRGKHSNTFFTQIPYDLSVIFDENKCLASDTKVSQRQGLYESSYAFDWNLQRIFFSPVTQLMEVTPAYLHKTSYSQYGHAPSGSFDIGRWFRPSSPTFQLWGGETQFNAKQGEAHLYFNFPNDKKIVLQEFLMTDDLYKIMNWCLSYKDKKPNTPLKGIYEDFNNNNLNELIMNNIQNNLVSPKL